MIQIPNPFPEPNPGAGNSSYESQFNQAYWKSKRPELQPFYYQVTGLGTPLTQDEKWILADALYKKGILFDEEIDAQSWGPYETMYMRSQYGYLWTPAGQGNVASREPFDLSLLFQPMPPGNIVNSLDINDYPPYTS